MPLYEIEEPETLVEFRTRTPLATWNQLKGDSDVNNSVKRNTFLKTGGLCVYCEIKLIPKLDYQIEHFNPKLGNNNSNFGEGVPNRAIEWLNLFPSCLGGTAKEKDFGPEDDHSSRIGANKRNKWAMTCGQLKGDREPGGCFISPEKLSNDISIYKYNGSDGSIEINEETCNTLEIDLVLATRHVQALNLDSKRLRGPRVTFTSMLEKEFALAMEFDVDNVESLIESWITLNEDGTLQHPFYSLIISKYKT
jgi:uncharacterized protein (TIGR02646 family)